MWPLPLPAPKPKEVESKKSIVVPPADPEEVMFEQLFYLCEHVAAGSCGCDVCKRYGRVREILLQPFL